MPKVLSNQRYERRLDAVNFQVRAAEGDDKPTVLEGYAARFDDPTTLYSDDTSKVVEMIRAGAFASALAENQDVRALVDHVPSLLLGRTSSGTLELREDGVGLYFRLTLPATQVARDLVENIRLGNVSQCSFAFSPRSNGEVITTSQADGRIVTNVELTDVDLYDISIVTYPAYPSTSVSVANRSRELLERAGRPKPSGRKAKTLAALKVVDHFINRKGK